MRIQTIKPEAKPRSSSWSNRFLIAAIAGILFLTLFPFRFDFQLRLPGNSSPFFLGSGVKTLGFLDALLNVLLFVPFGFGLAEKLRERKMSRTAVFFIVWITGAVFSYAIEISQIYIPMRDSGWEDVLTNSSGSIVGFVLFESLGTFTISLLSRCETVLRSWLTPLRAALFLSIYFLCWLAISAALQTQTRLSNWEPESLLLVGNEASGQDPWKGQLQRLQIGDRAVTDADAFQLTSGQPGSEEPSVWRAAYDFSNPPPFKDTKEFLPSLSWVPSAPLVAHSDAFVLTGKPWLASTAVVRDLVLGIRETNQFSLHIICASEEPHIGHGHILSISRSPSLVDLNLWQDESSLVLWFRSPVSVKRAMLAWYVPNIFTDTRPLNILYSYDGADLSLYVNGKKSGRMYRLGPGTVLARILRRVRPAELKGYNDIYYSLVFFPAGIILGLAARGRMQSNVTVLSAAALISLLPVFLLEFILVWVSGRPVSAWNLFLSAMLLVAGFLWIRSDSVSSNYGHHNLSVG